MARLSSASIRLVQKMNRVNKYGEYPIYIVICWKGRVEKSTGVSCLSRHWDARRQEIKNSCPNAPILNKTISDIKKRCIDRKNEFEFNQKRYTCSMLLDDDIIIDLSANENEYKVIYRNYLLEMGSSDNTIKLYNYTFRVLKEYFGKDDFLINNQKIACVIDIRNGENNTELFELVAQLQKDGVAKVIFLNANDKVILDRYKETRRKHPVMLRKNLSLEEAVSYEKDH